MSEHSLTSRDPRAVRTHMSRPFDLEMLQVMIRVAAGILDITTAEKSHTLKTIHWCGINNNSAAGLKAV